MKYSNIAHTLQITLIKRSKSWKIEEYHRQVKQDFSWEDIRLQKYQRVKTMNTILHFAMVFIYEQMSLQNFYIQEAPELILDKRKLNSLPKFLYYRIAK